jgi:hypothetical protein
MNNTTSQPFVRRTDRVRERSSEIINQRIDQLMESSLANTVRQGRDAVFKRLAELDREWDIDRALMLNFAIWIDVRDERVALVVVDLLECEEPPIMAATLALAADHRVLGNALARSSVLAQEHRKGTHEVPVVVEQLVCVAREVFHIPWVQLESQGPIANLGSESHACVVPVLRVHALPGVGETGLVPSILGRSNT